ncbi:MAG: hypothetical protein JO267_10690 [Alphaproteobacteria bacterium]|nr:hypothetical protein [Alphaproteobacteria bacterium]
MSAVAEARAPRVSTATEFVFQHKVFQVPDGVFTRTANDEIAFHFRLGDLTAALTIPVLAHEFGLSDASSDGHLLRTVVAGLRYVREIRPNDSIPRELLDGTASWSVEERHRRRARNRLLLAISMAEEPGPAGLPEDEQIDAAAEAAQRDPEWQSRLQRFAATLDLDRAQLMERIGAVGRELSYIEGLRDRFRQIHNISAKLAQLGQLYRRDETLFQAVLRTSSLLKPPTRDYAELFRRVDAETADIAGLLRRHHAQIGFIRQIRDDLHERTMIWGRLPDAWQEVAMVRSTELENQIKELYRFVAHHFPQSVDWRSGVAR